MPVDKGRSSLWPPAVFKLSERWSVMKYLVSGSQMKEVDRYTIETIGIPSMVLMERAAYAVACEAVSYTHLDVYKRQVLQSSSGFRRGLWYKCSSITFFVSQMRVTLSFKDFSSKSSLTWNPILAYLSE